MKTKSLLFASLFVLSLIPACGESTPPTTPAPGAPGASSATAAPAANAEAPPADGDIADAQSDWPMGYAYMTGNLKRLAQTLKTAIEGGDLKTYIQLTRNLLADEERARPALSASISADKMSKFKALWAEANDVADPGIPAFWGLKPERTEVHVHRATGAQIAAGTAPEFARLKDAAGVLRPEKWYFAVEFVEPGKTEGTKFDLFFWDATRKMWCLLGPINRV